MTNLCKSLLCAHYHRDEIYPDSGKNGEKNKNIETVEDLILHVVHSFFKKKKVDKVLFPLLIMMTQKASHSAFLIKPNCRTAPLPLLTVGH